MLEDGRELLSADVRTRHRLGGPSTRAGRARRAGARRCRRPRSATATSWSIRCCASGSRARRSSWACRPTGRDHEDSKTRRRRRLSSCLRVSRLPNGGVRYFFFVISLYAVSTKVSGRGGGGAPPGAAAAGGAAPRAGAPGAGASGNAALIPSSVFPSFTIAAILLRRSVTAVTFR